MNAAKVHRGATCAIWGLGGVGMCVAMGCRDSGASKVIGIDTNPKKFDLGKNEFSGKCTDLSSLFFRYFEDGNNNRNLVYVFSVYFYGSFDNNFIRNDIDR